MVVVYAGTRNLYPCMLPSIKSLLKYNSPEKVYLLIEDDEFPYELPDVCECINVSRQTWFPKGNANSDSVFTYMACTRICYAYLFPNIDKILQLDVDTIICGSLEDLWDTNLEGKWMAACPEYKGSYNPYGNDKYYNIGVCLFNLDQMRKDNVLPTLINYINITKLWCVEQDALNRFAVPDKVMDIDVKYNESFCCGQTDDPVIVHYAGYPDWWTKPNLPRREYLDMYR